MMNQTSMTPFWFFRLSTERMRRFQGCSSDITTGSGRMLTGLSSTAILRMMSPRRLSYAPHPGSQGCTTGVRLEHGCSGFQVASRKTSSDPELPIPGELSSFHKLSPYTRRPLSHRKETLIWFVRQSVICHQNSARRWPWSGSRTKPMPRRQGSPIVLNPPFHGALHSPNAHFANTWPYEGSRPPNEKQDRRFVGSPALS